jgi:hypothetical protein
MTVNYRGTLRCVLRGGGLTTLSNARWNASGFSSTSTSRAVSMNRFSCSGSCFGRGGNRLRGMRLSRRTGKCIHKGCRQDIGSRSRQPLGMLLSPPLEYKQILPDSNIARTRLDRNRRKAVEPTHLVCAVKISRQIGGAGQTIRCCVFAVADSGALPIEIVACNAGCACRNGSEHHRREHRHG